MILELVIFQNFHLSDQKNLTPVFIYTLMQRNINYGPYFIASGHYIIRIDVFNLCFVRLGYRSILFGRQIYEKFCIVFFGSSYTNAFIPYPSTVLDKNKIWSKVSS